MIKPDLIGGRMPLSVRHPQLHELRETRVMLDVDLAEVFGLAVRELRRQTTRNCERFPESSLLRLSTAEKKRFGIPRRQ